MKTKQIFLLVALMTCFQWSNGQNESKEETLIKDVTLNKPGKPIVTVTQPCMVLKVDDKTLKVDKGPFAKITLNEINPNWISSINVRKDHQAIEEFGEEAKGGVIVITFKDFNTLSKELQDAFNEIKKVE
jgi:hypothetical protein